jgi:hypothetical protein
MKKLFLLVLVVLIGGAGYLYWNLGNLAQTLIEEQGSATIGTSVRVDGVKFDLFDGQVTVRGLKVANPKGYSDRDAFAVDEITVGVSFDASSRKLIVFDEIVVDRPRLTYEKSGGTSNLDEIKKKAQGGSTGGSSKESDLRFIVSKLQLTDGEITAIGLSPTRDELNAVLPGFTLRDVGKDEGGLSAEALGRRVSVAITGRVIEAVLAGTLFDLLANPAEGVSNSVEGLSDSADGVTDAVGDLFGGD